MEEKKNGNKGLVVLVVILLLACIGMGYYIGYEKILSNNKCITKENLKSETNSKNEEETTTEKENTTTTVESDKKDTNEKTETTRETETINNTIETRSCTGTYSGQGAVTQDARTGQNTNGTITIELKEDSTYKLTKSGMDQYWAGHYIIVENALLLKEAPSTCGPGADCSEKYFSFLNIADDCSKITDGYGSVFFDPNFILTKNN